MPERRAYADVIGNFRRGQADAYVRGGDPERAAEVVGDPALAESYARQADRQRVRQDRDETRAYGRDMAGALHRGDYDAAGAAAARFGDPAGVTAARTGRTEASEQERLNGWRALQTYGDEIGALPDGEAGAQSYGAILSRAIQESAASPELQDQIRRLPQQWGPGVRERVQGVVRTWQNRLLTAAQIATLQQQRETREAGQRRNLTAEEASALGLRPGTVAQTDASGQVYVVQSPLTPGAGGSSFSMLSPGEAEQLGLPPGSYQRNDATGQVSVVGRSRGQYTEGASAAAQYGYRMSAADQTLTQLEASATDPSGVFVAQAGMGSQYERQVRQAQREFVNAILRRESGAVISDSEFASAAQQYFPQPGDGPAVIAQKRAARQRSIQGLRNASQGAYDEWYGEGSGAELPPPQGPVGSAAGAIAGAMGANMADIERPREIPADEWMAMTPDERNRTIQILGRRAPE